jgi:hypothetical protein
LVGHFISAIVFVVFSLFAGDNYTIDHVLNGKRTIQFLERYVEQLLLYIKDSIQTADQTMIINRDSLNADTRRMFKNKTVKSTVAKSDGLLPTCKSTWI